MPETPTLAEVIRRAWDARMLDVHTAMPGKVVAYDAATQTADVQPMLRRPMRDQDGERVVEELPVVPGVPVMWPSAGGYCLTMPLAAGDSVLLVFAEGAIDAWRGTGDAADPGDERRFNLSHAIAIPGLFTVGNHLASAAADHLALARDSGAGAASIHVRSAEVRLGTDAASDFVALASLVTAQFNALKAAISGAAVSAGDGGAAFKANLIAALAAWPSTIAATKVKAI